MYENGIRPAAASSLGEHYRPTGSRHSRAQLIGPLCPTFFLI
jgi:hypothetical protein